MAQSKKSQVRYRAVDPTAPSQRSKLSLLAPATIVIAFLFGTGLAVGHHCYYAWLDGKLVGDISRQQWSLRIGNFFAVAVSICLKYSVSAAYFQAVWYKLRCKYISLKTIDNTFDAITNVSSFLDWELLLKLDYAIPIAIVVWLLPLISLFPPATLSIVLGTHHTQIVHLIRLPGLFNQSTPVGSFDSGLNIGDVPIPQLEEDIFTSNFVDGEIKRPIDLNFGAKTYANYSYSATMNLPRLHCTTVSATELSPPLHNATLTWLGKSGVCSTCPPCITSMDRSTWSLYSNCSSVVPNQEQHMHGLYFGLTYLDSHAFPRSDIVPSIPDSGSGDGNILIILAPSPSAATVSNCTATNSTVAFTVRYLDGVPTITTDSIVDHGTYWAYDSSGDITRVMDFTAIRRWMGGIFGWIGGYKSYYSSSTGGSYYSMGSVQGTVLTLSRDFYDVAKAIDLGSEEGGNIQLPAPEDVKNISMAQMVEELSLNISLSYMSQDLLSFETPATIQVSSTENIYSYDPTNLYVSYGAGIFTSCIAIVVGIISFLKSGMHIENKLSTIGAVMQHPNVSRRLRGKAGIRLDEARSIKLKLMQSNEYGAEFVPEGPAV